MRATQKTFAEEFERVLVESDTSVRRLARLTGVSRRTFENWLYGNTLRPRYFEQILQAAHALQLQAVDTDRLLLSAGHPTLTRLRQNKQLPPDILLEWQLPPDTQKGQKYSALDYAQQLLKQIPWNEEAHREVMEMLALIGRRSEALKQFELCKQSLHDELGIVPSAETLVLYERIRRSAHFSRDNIPAIVTPLIGREGELETISSMLADSDVRLVTITGLGGIGKTQLALDLAWRHTKGQFHDGVTFVQLAPLESAELIVTAIAQALHLPLSVTDENPALQQLLDYLKSKQMLLILDNCEHLSYGMSIVTDIIETMSNVQVLATSREPLRLHGEHIFALQGLGYGGDQARHPAALLFSSAAKRVDPNFEINDSNAADINQLCHMVGGMPLALELAATWLDTIPVTAVVAEIEDNLDFLSADMKNILSRHGSLPAVLESTWSRLQPQTQQAFTALSAFRGSFTRDAAVEVAGASPRLLTQLVAHSLLEFDREEDRYQLHEMLRQFAAEKLAGTSELEQAANQSHFAFYNDLALRGGAAMRGGDQVHWMARLELEENNIRQAIDWAVNNDIDSAARLAVSLHTFWHTKGRYQEGAQLYERFLPHEEQLSPDIHPWLLSVYAEMIWKHGRIQESVALESTALSSFWEQGDDSGAAYIYSILSNTALVIGNTDSSIQLAEAGLQHALAPGVDSHYASLMLRALGDALTRAGRFDEAGVRLRQGFQLCEQRNDQITANYFLAQMLILSDIQGQYAETRRLGKQCLRVSRHLDILLTEIMALNNLGLSCHAEDELDLAHHYFGDALALAREANYRFAVGVLAGNLSDSLMAKGAYSEALKYLREATSIAQEFGGPFDLGECVERLAFWTWSCNNHSIGSVRWLACASAVFEQSGRNRSPFWKARLARVSAEMNTGLGEEAFARLWAEGEQMSIEEALEEIYHALPLSLS